MILESLKEFVKRWRKLTKIDLDKFCKDAAKRISSTITWESNREEHQLIQDSYDKDGMEWLMLGRFLCINKEIIIL
ncbi:hypothetical protein [Clostridioides difficile]|uniref:hypothetical protein n=1 Tax=Clostridioides difficile TaxID=1496 RepID=UPI001EDA42A7|nr:hypothetical protein [Clostridioides difficile]